ncbi:TetR/AcrR family transcriptional regulator [Eubacteriaceae bacterium ES2]|nr:TetR/AcrR family transcriptional regulator [Eubacteriaceae bacterium ES2]
MKNNPNRTLILNTARKSFYMRGYKNTSIRMIASDLNMSNVNLFNYFKNKREILRILFDDFLDSMYCPLNQITQYSEHPVEAMLVGIYVFQYSLSYNKRLSELYSEALEEDIIVKIFVRNLYPFCKEITELFSQQKISDNELIYTLYSFYETMMSINNRVAKKELSFAQDFLRDQHARLFYRLFYLNKHDFETEEKKALAISRKYNYGDICNYWTTDWIDYDQPVNNS